MRTIRIIPAALVSAALLAGCANMNRSGKGAVIGTGTGAVLGGAIGKASGNTAAGAIIGAAVGGMAGAAIGHYMDQQAAELQRDLKNAKVERVGEGIKITFNSGILFDVDKDDLRRDARSNLTELAQTLNKYEDTEILVQGHTDATGSDQHNLDLSERRADAVADFLKGKGVKGARIDEEGLGETLPVADNSSEAGKQANRRVEVAIWANEKLKRAAADGKIETAEASIEE